MDTSQRGFALLRSYENFSPVAYLCPEKVWTIGYGSIRWSARKPVQPGETIDRAGAERLMRKEVDVIENEIDQAVKVPLTQGQFDCLVSWGYNVGIGWINGKRPGGAAKLIGYLNKGRYDLVPGELVKFKRGAKSKKAINGLLNRRKRELRELWFSDHDAGAEGFEHTQELAPAAPGALVPRGAQPQAVEIEEHKAPAAEVVKESPTAQWSLVGTLSTLALMIQKAWQFIFEVAGEAGQEAVTQQPNLTAFESLFRVIGMNFEYVLLAVLLASTLVVLLRRLAKG